MATKKKTEVEATEVVEEVKEELVEAAVEEAPKKTSKKSSKKAEVVEEVKEEAPVAEPAPVVEEVKEEAPKKEKVVAAPVATSDSFEVKVISSSGIYSFKNPGLDQPKGKVYPKGTKLIVSEVKGNWGKVGQNAWIILSCVAKV